MEKVFATRAFVSVVEQAEVRDGVDARLDEARSPVSNHHPTKSSSCSNRESCQPDLYPQTAHQGRVIRRPPRRTRKDVHLDPSVRALPKLYHALHCPRPTIAEDDPSSFEDGAKWERIF